MLIFIVHFRTEKYSIQKPDLCVRLETYVITGSDPSVEEWIQFSRADMLIKITKGRIGTL